MTAEQLEVLVRLGESETLEFKRTTGQRTEAAKTVCAMLNNRGGRVVFGIVSDKTMVGQQVSDRTVEEIADELHRLLVDGIKYDRLPATSAGAEWEMMLFRNEELVNYLTALQVRKSVYEYVVYDSQIERAFAEQLDQRDDIKVFVKLPAWFQIDTPVGKYNPDWAILKHDGHALYLVRETKGTHDFLKLRTSEADKVRCGQRHFEALGVPFEVVTSADEV